MMNTKTAIDFQITLEERISQVYREIGDSYTSGSDSRSDEDAEWAEFWGKMAADEANHASLLSIEKTFLHTGTRLKGPLEIDPEGQNALEVFLSKCEERIQSGITQKEAIEILTTLECSGEGGAFSSLLKATDSKVLDHVANFSRAHSEHDKRVKEAIERYGDH